MAKSSDNIVPFRRSPPGGASRPAGWRPPAWLTHLLTRTVTGWLILANVAIWIAMVAWSLGSGILTPFPAPFAEHLGVLDPPLVAHQPWRLVTAAFLHASLLHIAMNMAFLGWVGARLEKAYGKGRFLLVYAISLLGAELASWGWHSIPGFEAVSVGASGAIMGVIGALFGLAYRAEGWSSQLTRFWGVNALLIIGLGIVLGLFGSEGPIDNACHVGGFVCGTAAGYLFAGKPPIPKTAERALFVGFAAVVVACFGFALFTPNAESFATPAVHAEEGIDVLLGRAEDRIELHHVDEARADLERAFSIVHDGDPDRLHRIAFDAMRLGDRDLARHVAIRAVAYDPSDKMMKDLLDHLAQATTTTAAQPSR